MVRIVLVLAACAVAQDATPLVYSKLSDYWSLAVADIQREKQRINADYTNRGLGCSGMNGTAQNDAVISITSAFYDQSLEYIEGRATLKRPLNRDSISAKFSTYKDRAVAQTIKTLCGEPFSNASASASLSGELGAARQSLAMIIPPELSRPDLAIDSVEAFFSKERDSIYCFYVVKNIGSESSNAFDVVFGFNGQDSVVIEFPALKPGDYAPDHRGTKIVKDTTSISILADAGGAVEEISKSNNLARDDFLTPVSVRTRPRPPKSARGKSKIAHDALGRTKQGGWYGR